MNCTRRNFLIGGSASVFLTGINFSSQAIEKNKKNLIIISLRGGMDGLTAIPVIGDKNLTENNLKNNLDNSSPTKNSNDQTISDDKNDNFSKIHGRGEEI